MPTLKMLPLDLIQKPPFFKGSKEDMDYFKLEEVPEHFQLVGSDGRFLADGVVWFEVGGKGYRRKPDSNSDFDEVKQFKYELEHGEEHLLRADEEAAIRRLLVLTKDAKVKKVLSKKIKKHEVISSVRNSRKQIRLYFMRKEKGQQC